jgi:hypothetical protein
MKSSGWRTEYVAFCDILVDMLGVRAKYVAFCDTLVDEVGFLNEYVAFCDVLWRCWSWRSVDKNKDMPNPDNRSQASLFRF